MVVPPRPVRRWYAEAAMMSETFYERERLAARVRGAARAVSARKPGAAGQYRRAKRALLDYDLTAALARRRR